MGLMRFQVQPLERITEEMAGQAYLSGIDGSAWPIHNTLEDGLLLMQRAVSDSGNLNIPWTLPDGTQLVFSSGTLMESDRPYLLPLEIARGTVGKILTQLFEWQSIGLNVPPELSAMILSTVRQLGSAAVMQSDPGLSAELSERVLASAVAVANRLAAVYTEQALTVRLHGCDGKLDVYYGADLGSAMLDSHTAKHFKIAFNAANVPMRWRDLEAVEGHYDWTVYDQQIEWCKKHGLRVSAGPLLLLDSQSLPDWLTLWEDDFENLFNCFTDHFRAVIERYRGKVDFWQCAGRVNTSELFSLTEEEKLNLTARAIEIIRYCDPNTPIYLSIDQPWAEYMTRHENEFHPLHFAEVLIRSDLGITGLILELNMGYCPYGTLPRDPLEFSRMLDIWTGWGLPLWLSISAPSLCDADPLAQVKSSVPQGTWTPAVKQKWIARHVPLMLAKGNVQGILWNQLHDGRPHDLPYGGLFDLHGKTTPALRTLASIRKKILK